jgi:hypothetical protein
MNTYIRNTERAQLNCLMLHLKILQKQEANPKTKKERNNKTIQKINKTKSWFFEKIWKNPW